MVTSTDYQDFIDFLEIYQTEDFAESLHKALFYVIGEGELQDDKQDVCGVLYQLRMDLNDLQAKYLSSQTPSLTRFHQSK